MKQRYHVFRRGWSTVYGGLVLKPEIGSGTSSVSANGFGFTITGVSNQIAVVEASTSLANPNWQPVQTNTLAGTPVNFTDSQWTNYPNRYYRVRLENY